MKLKTIDIHGFTGSGATLAEARADAMREVGQAIEKSYDPVLVTWRGFTKLLWHTPQGICSAWMRDGEKLSSYCHHGRGARMETERQWACVLIAQEAHGIDCEDTPYVLTTCEPWAHSRYWSWVSFQRAYRAASNLKDTTERHRWAQDHAQEFSNTTEKAA